MKRKVTKGAARAAKVVKVVEKKAIVAKKEPKGFERVAELLARHKAGLTVREVADNLKVTPGAAAGTCKNCTVHGLAKKVRKDGEVRYVRIAA